jgi:uncharacterized protein YbbK (DUF523 family)
MYIVSACLLGENVKYSGGNNFTEAVVEFLKDKEFIPVCPEVLGGLTIPREPCERLGDRVINKSGADVTEAFHKGAERCLENVLKKVSPGDIEGAILKARSPSCGSEVIYDGTFSGAKIPGDGVFTELLKSKGIKVMTELDFEETDLKQNLDTKGVVL